MAQRPWFAVLTTALATSSLLLACGGDDSPTTRHPSGNTSPATEASAADQLNFQMTESSATLTFDASTETKNALHIERWVGRLEEARFSVEGFDASNNVVGHYEFTLPQPEGTFTGSFTDASGAGQLKIVEEPASIESTMPPTFHTWVSHLDKDLTAFKDTHPLAYEMSAKTKCALSVVGMMGSAFSAGLLCSVGEVYSVGIDTALCIGSVVSFVAGAKGFRDNCQQ